MTAKQEPKGRTLYLVDGVGGGLATLAVGVARSLGIEALAATSVARAPIPDGIARVLEEVGMRAPEGEVRPLEAALSATDVDIIFLGSERPAALAGKRAWDVELYAGEGELEQLATARIARDRIERKLELTRLPS